VVDADSGQGDHHPAFQFTPSLTPHTSRPSITVEIYKSSAGRV
jgi:hypothetical protein